MSQLTPSKKLAYGVAEIGGSLSFAAVNAWLLYFLINIARLEPLAAGTVFIIGRLFDAFLDPAMGIVSDRTKVRWGRKFFIKWGALPLGVSFALLWIAPGNGRSAVFGLVLTRLLFFSLLYTVVQMPYLALTPELAPDYDDRTRLSSYRAAFGTVAGLQAFALPPTIVLTLAPASGLAASSPRGWLGLGVIFGTVTALSYLVMTAIVPEPSRPPQVTPKSRVAPWREFRSTLRITGFREIIVIFITIAVGSMIASSILPFYLESALHLPGGQQSFILALLFGVAVLTLPIWNFVSAQLGKRLTLILGLILLSSSLMALVLGAGDGISPFLIIMIIPAGIGLSAQLLLPWAMLPDIVEFDELQHGRRREGLIYALFTFGQKIAGSLGVFVNAIVAALAGYQQGVVIQAPHTVQAIRLMVGPMAAVFFLTAAALAWRYPITRKQHERTRALLKRPADRKVPREGTVDDEA